MIDRGTGKQKVISTTRRRTFSSARRPDNELFSRRHNFCRQCYAHTGIELNLPGFSSQLFVIQSASFNRSCYMRSFSAAGEYIDLEIDATKSETRRGCEQRADESKQNYADGSHRPRRPFPLRRARLQLLHPSVPE